MLKERPEITELLALYDVKEEGTCQAATNVPKAMMHSYPFAFPARIKGDTGEYKFLIVIDYVSSISDTHNRIIAGYKVPDQLIGISIWPLPKPVPAP